MSIPRPMVGIVLDRDNGVCVHCGGWGASVADHRVNRGAGGSRVLNDPANLVAAHGGCNGSRENATGLVLLDLIERGIKVRPAATHAASLDRARLTPVEYPDGSWWLLASDGTRERVRGGHGENPEHQA